MKIILAVTGGIACYKALSLVSVLDSKGHEVQVVMTDHAKKFVNLVSFAALSHRPVITDEDEWGDKASEIPHIYYPQKWKADVFVVAPATANIIGKFANGIADDVVSSMYMACPAYTPKLIFPAMNEIMYSSCALQRNIKTLVLDCCFVGKVETKKLACGNIGKGGLALTEHIVEQIEYYNTKSNDERK
jgi:phosphopantothenoylcysteine decarboxylase/phosphopantothenate--cysteine ligase